MRYAHGTAAAYCSVELNARTIYVIVFNTNRNTRFEGNLSASFRLTGGTRG